MAAFRFHDQDPVYLDTAGAPCAGGSLTFYDNGTTTPKDVYGDSGLSVNNGNIITLDSSGRSPLDLWLSGAYSVVLKNSSGSIIWTKDDVQQQGASVPSGTNGQAVFIDGAGNFTVATVW